jgi:hypothetical protein
MTRAIPPKFRKDYPDRVVDWRWQQAKLLDDSRSDDALIDLARRFYLDLKTCQEEVQKAVLYDHYPIFYIAWEIYDSISKRKAELEARILARQTFDLIANRMGLPLDVVTIYEAVFFNVLDRIDNVSYICNHALSMEPNVLKRDQAELWKVIAYFAGSQADSVEFIDEVLFPKFGFKISNLDELDDIIDKELGSRVFITLKFFGDDKENLQKLDSLIRNYNKRSELRRNKQQREDLDELYEYFRNTLSSIGWSKVEPIAGKKDIKSIEYYRQQNE